MGTAKSKDALRLLEAAYSFVPDERAWLTQVVEALRPYDLGGGIAAYVSELGERIAVRSEASAALEVDVSALHAMAEFLPPPFYRHIHAPTPLISSSESFPAAAAAVGIEFGTSWPVNTPFPVPRFAWAIAGGDAGVETVLITFHCDPGQGYSARDHHALDCLAAHLGSVLRLRSLLRSNAPSAEDDAVEVVLAPDGEVLDARGEERDDEALRSSLVESVRRSEKAKLRRATAEERVEVWTALVEGRWSILENVERDGKRTLLAYRNDPRTSPMRLLTPRERSVATYAALGHSFKYIAYELGIALSTAAACLESALRKLGLASRAELIQIFGRGPVDASSATATRE